MTLRYPADALTLVNFEKCKQKRIFEILRMECFNILGSKSYILFTVYRNGKLRRDSPFRARRDFLGSSLENLYTSKCKTFSVLFSCEADQFFLEAIPNFKIGSCKTCNFQPKSTPLWIQRVRVQMPPFTELFEGNFRSTDWIMQ